MDGAEERAVEFAQRLLATSRLLARRGRLANLALEPHLEPLAQLVRRLAREGHRRETFHRRARAHVFQHPVHERRGLSRARPRLYQHVGLKVGADAVARRLVLRLSRHGSPTGERRANMVAYSGSASACAAAQSARWELVLLYRPRLARQID